MTQEEELRKSSDPKYQHLNDDLHVEITAFAPPSEAHARIAYALTEVSKILTTLGAVHKGYPTFQLVSRLAKMGYEDI